MDSFDALTPVEQRSLLVRLSAYARRLLRHQSGGFPGDWDPDDLVMDVMVKYVNGTRRITERATLEQHLFGGVRSSVSALRKRASSKVSINIVAEERDFGNNGKSPEFLLQRTQWNEAVRDALEGLALEDDDLLEVVSILEESGDYKVSELMAKRGWSETEARRMRRKLMRALPRAEAIAKKEVNNGKV